MDQPPVHKKVLTMATTVVHQIYYLGYLVQCPNFTLAVYQRVHLTNGLLHEYTTNKIL